MSGDLGTLLGGVGGELGFGGVAGAVVGYTAKKVTKLIALALGLVFLLIQYLVYVKFISVDWNAVQDTAYTVWQDPAGVTLADRAWQVLSANLPFGGAFVAGFALGFKLG
ncbi:MAG: FUN14 domain-containing protein [Candidatus Binatia bacterium]